MNTLLQAPGKPFNPRFISALKESEGRNCTIRRVKNPLSACELAQRGVEIAGGGVMTTECAGIKAVRNHARINRGGASEVWMLEDAGNAGSSGKFPGRIR